jgi:chaperonin GroEL
MLQDIAVLTGARVITEEIGLKLENVELKQLGRAKKVIASKDKTTIVRGAGKKVDIDERISVLRAQIADTDNKYDKEKLQERLGKLGGGVAVIKVGAATEAEMKYLKLKIEDAVEATKAAIEEGVVPGGGVALVRAGSKVAGKTLKAPSEDIAHEFEVGVGVLLRSLEAPLRQIAINAGKDNGEVIVDKIKNGKGSEGYDANADKIVADMFASGIIDPVKVTRTGLERAASAAAILLTTEVAVTDEPKEEKAVPEMPGGMGY